MHEDEDVVLNVKAIALAVGGAALAGLLLVLARRDDQPEPAARAEAAAKDARKDAKKAAKAARRKGHDLKASAEESGERLAHEVKERAADAGVDVGATERDLKAAAWDAEQAAREAEHRLRAAGHRVAGDAANLATWVGSEARNLAGEGRERIAQLRHREEPEQEIARLRAEVEELRAQLGRKGRRADRELSGIAARFAGKKGTVREVMASEATVAALAQLERSLKAKAPALLAAKNRGQVLEIIQQELGPTLKETAVQAATAALTKWDSTREAAETEVRERAGDVDEEVREAAHRAREAARAAAEEARAKADEAARAARANGKHRLWHHRDDGEELAAEAARSTEVVRKAAAEAVAPTEEEHRGKAGLFWGGAGLGLALYAMLDAERREHVLRLANEASIQVQELVRDLQGYDDEF